MKLKNTSVSIFILLLLSSFLVGCWDKESAYYLRGKIISNYPDWLNPRGEVDCAEGVSEWLDWQSEQGMLLHDYVDNSVIDDSYSGKFRICLDGQDIALRFNDKECTGVVIIFNWVGAVPESFYSVSQTDIDNKFEYDCHSKTSLYDGESEKNKARVSITRLKSDSDENEFNYKLAVAGKIIIDIELKNNLKSGEVPVDISEHSWIPDDVSCLYRDTATSILKLRSFLRFEMENDLRTFRNNWPACYEGISLRGEIDDEKQEISFNLLDAEQSDFADYFTLKVAEDKESAAITYYKLENGIPSVVRSDENLEFWY